MRNEIGFETLTLDHIDSSAMLKCVFECESGNLWHVFVGDGEMIDDISLLLSDAVVRSLERQYENFCEERRINDFCDPA